MRERIVRLVHLPERPVSSALTIKLGMQEEVYTWESVVREGDSEEEFEIIIAPRTAEYDPTKLQAMLLELTDEIAASYKPTIKVETQMIGLGFKHDVVQFRESEAGVGEEKLRYVTVRMVAHEGIVHALADYRSRRIRDLVPHIPSLADLGFYTSPELLEAFRGREKDLIGWAQEQISRVLPRKDETSNSKS